MANSPSVIAAAAYPLKIIQTCPWDGTWRLGPGAPVPVQRERRIDCTGGNIISNSPNVVAATAYCIKVALSGVRAWHMRQPFSVGGDRWCGDCSISEGV